MTIRIERYKTINNSPAVALATKGWLENIEKGTGENVVAIGWDHKAVVAFDSAAAGGECAVGVITWSHIEYRNEVYAEQAYVLPPWRGRKIFSRMWAELLIDARKLGVRGLRLGTHMNNAHARAIYTHLGGVESFVTIEFPL